MRKRGLKAPIYTDEFTLILIDAGYAPERAAYIVRAVEAHEEMLKALKAAAISLIDDEHYQEFKPLLETVKKAIAKAEGKS